MSEVWIVFFLFDDFNFFGVVFRIGVVVETSVGCFSEPVVSCFELIVEVLVVIFFWRFVDEFVCVGAFCSQGEVSSCVSISGFHVLIISFVSWEL